MRVIIAGGGGTGCFAALLLARAGHEVIVAERENRGPAPDAEAAAASAFRPTAPQIVQPHIIMARCRELLIQYLPDVYEALLKAGVVEAPLPTQMPASLPDQSPRPGDERLIQLLTRRSTVDWVLLRAVTAEPGVTFRPGVRVTGLVADKTTEPPRVTGLHAIGDTVCTTNPTLARGLALAMTNAVDLTETITRHADDPYAQALALDGLVAEHVEPFYAEQAAVDGARLAQMRQLIFGGPEPAPAPDPAGRAPADADRVTYGQVRAAMPFDPVAFRAFWRVMGMIATPEEAYTDPDVIARTRAVLAARGGTPPVPGPTREQLRHALGPA